MNDPVDQRIVFEQVEQPEDCQLIDKKQFFDTSDLSQFSLINNDIENEQQDSELEGLVQKALKSRYSVWQKIVIVGVSIFLFSGIAQAIHWLKIAWQQQNWIALSSTLAVVLIILAAIGAIVSEFRHLYNLRERADERDNAKLLLASHDQGKAKTFCQKLIQQAGLDKNHPAVLRWVNALHETHNDREVVILYAKLVQPVLDERAKRDISRFAAESALMIAVSPLALIDMAFIAWRNLKLINQIAGIYGIELGYLSRMRLFKLVLINIAFAGVTELVREVGMDWMSQDLVAKLSARAAQGIGIGLLTARLGIKAMELCRSLPWIENDRPKLSEFRREIFNLLRQTLPKKQKNS